jgi:hypothetical protein
MKKTKPKKPTSKSRGGRPRGKLSPTALATELGVSRQTVWHALKSGATVSEIRQRAAHWHAIVEARQHPGKRTDKAVDAIVNGAVDRGNGHAADNSGIPAYTVSQAKKEAMLASLRELEVESKRGELAPVAKMQGWVVESIAFERKHTWTLPTLLRERGHATAGDLAERLVRRIFGDSDAFMRRRASHYGLRLPPPLPPPPPAERLPSYLQYARDSISGETGVIPPGERLGSAEWRLAHPSIGIQEEFAIMAKKRAWDKAMGELLNTRSTWDLPPEHPATPASELEAEHL